MSDARPGALIGVELNARAVVAALQQRFREPPYRAPPKTPVLFFKTANTLVGDGDPVVCPRGEARLQARPNLVLVIGAAIAHRRFDGARLGEHLAGYTILNDISLPIVDFYRPPVRAKGFDTFGPLARAVSREAIGDPHAVTIETRVNGALRQRASTRELLRGPVELIRAITDIMALRAGDMVALGAPGEPIDCAVGDELTVAIEGIGRLTNRIVPEP